MGRWYRVFAADQRLPAAAAILDQLRASGVEVSGEFEQDDTGWYAATVMVERTSSLRLERFLAEEEGIRGELNSWAAWLETCEDSPQHVALMERMIQVRQLFTLTSKGAAEDQVMMERLCVQLCRFLALTTAGVWQADGEGVFAADGALLVEER